MIAYFLRLIGTQVSHSSGPPPGPTENNFDFVVETAAYSDPAGEGPFDFKVA